MTLSLDHNQRLNVHVLLGFLDCTSLHETRLVWGLMDRLMLDDEEKRAIDFQAQGTNGNEAYSWNQAKSIAVRKFELSEGEAKQVQRALEPYLTKWRIPVKSRGWLEPLLAQLPQDWLEVVMTAQMEPAK